MSLSLSGTETESWMLTEVLIRIRNSPVAFLARVESPVVRAWRQVGAVGDREACGVSSSLSPDRSVLPNPGPVRTPQTLHVDQG